MLLYALSLNFLNYPVPAFQFYLNTVFTQCIIIEPIDQTGSLMMLSPLPDCPPVPCHCWGTTFPFFGLVWSAGVKCAC